MARKYGQILYTLTSLLVAAYDINNDTYGTPILWADGQMFTTEPEADTDVMRSYGTKSRGLTVVVGSKINIKGGGLDTDILAIVGSVINVEAGSSGHRIRTSDFPAGGNGLGYFGVIGTAAADGGGLGMLGHRAVKLDNLPKIDFNGETNKYNMFETAGYSYIQTAISSKAFRLKSYEDAADYTPPSTGTEFKAFFA